MQTGAIMAHWWHVDATPSTSSERDGSTAGSSGSGKRPRDDGRTYVVPANTVNILFNLRQSVMIFEYLALS